MSENSESIFGGLSALPFSFSYNGSPAPLEDWDKSVAESGVPENRVITRRYVTDDGFAAETVTHIYNGKVLDYILYFENTGKKDSGRVSDINTVDVSVDMRPLPELRARVNNDAHLREAKHYTGDERFPILNLIRPNIGCACPNMDEMGAEARILKTGEEFNTESTSCGEPYAPYFELEAEGVSFAMAIGWTGRWKAGFINRDGIISIKGGLARGDFYLHPGERVRSCRVMLVRETGDPEKAYNAFRRAFIRYIAPRHENGELWYPPVAVPCTDENATDGANEINWVKNVLDDTDAEYYWLDAWWHVGGFPAGMGNYTFPIEKNVDPIRFPQGMRVFSDICREKGYGFLLWFAPETYPDGCTMADEHPEFLLHRGDSKGGTLNLTDPAAFDYAVKYFSECIREYGVNVFRTDSGFDLGLIWEHEEKGRAGVLEMKYVEALYRFWDTLITRCGVIIDNCCGGGTRLDLELCSRSICMWRTDSSVWYSGGDQVRAATMNQSFTVSFNRFIPWHVGGMFDYDPYTMRSAFNGGLTVNMDLRKPDFDKAKLRAAVAEAKRLRRYTCGDFYQLIFDGWNPDSWCAYQYHLPDENAGCAFVFRRHHSPYSSAFIELRGIDPRRRYEVDFYYGYEKAKTVFMTGVQLAGLSVELEGQPSSLLVEYRERADFIRK